MLSSSSNPFRSSRLNECILRRRARNLRAKVKALLPANICSKHDRRNRNVHNMLVNKENWVEDKMRQSACKCRWRIMREKQNELYFENPPTADRDQRFAKLTESQIEQIKQDKLYYLGEDNLRDFEIFLEEKDGRSKKNENPPKPLEIMGQILRSGLRDEKNNLFRSFSSKDPDLYFLTTRSNSSKLQNERKAIQFQQRRKMILEEEKSQRIMNKVKMGMRFEKVDANLITIRQKSRERMEKIKEEENQKIRRVKTRQMNSRNRGQIKLLEEQLRRTFLSKSTADD